MSEITIDYAGFRFLAVYEYSKGEMPEITHLYIYEKPEGVETTYLGHNSNASFQFIYDNCPGLFDKLEQAIEFLEEERRERRDF